ncbi:DUF2303 family protein [Parasutterella excrementihominis]|uniref:DUF2303 family protein n=1 Tax=Parasutterella excrementihominis TaxID=487175 RepID=UPI003AB20E28
MEDDKKLSQEEETQEEQKTSPEEMNKEAQEDTEDPEIHVHALNLDDVFGKKLIAKICEANRAQFIKAKAPFTFELEGVPFIAKPSADGAWSVQEYSELMERPKRNTLTISFKDLDSFCNYVRDHATEDSSLYLQPNIKKLEFSALACIDDCKRNLPNWRQEKVTYIPETSLEWEEWTKNNKEKMRQEEFALFLEEHLCDIVDDTNGKTTALTLLNAVTNLYEVRNVTYGSTVSLSNGMASFEFTEKNGASGKIQVPTEFVIGIPVFEDGPAYTIRAKLRYRIDRNNGSLCLWFELQLINRNFKNAIERQSKAISEKLTNVLPIYNGLI